MQRRQKKPLLLLCAHGSVQTSVQTKCLKPASFVVQSSLTAGSARQKYCWWNTAGDGFSMIMGTIDL